MANGTSRNALAAIALKGKPATSEMAEEMAILERGNGAKIPLKYPSEHNHSK